MLIAAAVTLTDIVLAFPIAFYIAKRATRHRELLLMLVVFPLWSSYLVRAFAWKTILGTNGILNSFLLGDGDRRASRSPRSSTPRPGCTSPSARSGCRS